MEAQWKLLYLPRSQTSLSLSLRFSVFATEIEAPEEEACSYCTLFCTVALAPALVILIYRAILTPFHFQAAPTLPKVNTTERLKELRQKMQQEDVQVYIIPSVDQHMVTCYQAMSWLIIDMVMKPWQELLELWISFGHHAESDCSKRTVACSVLQLLWCQVSWPPQQSGMSPRNCLTYFLVKLNPLLV